MYDTLISNLIGVIYSTRNRPDAVLVNGMIPDWIICNNKGCWLVEYFGLYTDRDCSSSHRLVKYHNKMKVKLDKYEELEKIGHKTLFIYPDDIRNGFDGLLKKIELLKC